jgi:hypothetical protein
LAAELRHPIMMSRLKDWPFRTPLAHATRGRVRKVLRLRQATASGMIRRTLHLLDTVFLEQYNIQLCLATKLAEFHQWLSRQPGLFFPRQMNENPPEGFSISHCQLTTFNIERHNNLLCWNKVPRVKMF